MNAPLAWISAPACVVAEPAERTPEPAKHLLYQRIYEAHGRPWTSAPRVGPVPDAWPQTAEDLAVGAVNPLLSGHGREDVEMFIDCRSGAMTSSPAPTYRLAMLADVTAATPVCIWGQDGPEVAFAISILIRRLSARGKAVLSACQCIVPPDTRAPAWTNLILGDAAAAVLLSKRRFPGSRPVLAVQTGRTACTDLLARALREAGLAEKPRWTLVAGQSEAETARHPRWPNIYFGAADILIKLAERSATPARAEVGALVMHGRAGTSAVMLLGTEKLDVT